MTIEAAQRSFKVNYSVVAFFLLAANLRPALTSVGPVLEAIRSSLGLSGAAAGLLATLPLLIFAGFSPFARLGARVRPRKDARRLPGTGSCRDRPAIRGLDRCVVWRHGDLRHRNRHRKRAGAERHQAR